MVTGKSSPSCLQAQAGVVVGCGQTLVMGEGKDGQGGLAGQGTGAWDRGWLDKAG